MRLPVLIFIAASGLAVSIVSACAPRPLGGTAVGTEGETVPTPHVTTSRALSHGLASFYGRAFHGQLTASGIPFDMHALVAAHPTYPFGTTVRVTNLRNGRQVVVRIVDRGPAPRYQRDGVVIDLSRGAAEQLRSIEDGRVPVRLEVLSWGRGNRQSSRH